MRRAGLAAALALLSAACDPPRGEGQSGAWFREEAGARGLHFTWQSGHRERHYFPEIMGGGAALVDLDEDGDLDAYLVQAGSVTAAPEERPGNQLFRNRGSGRFEDASAGSGAEDRGYGMGVAAGDCDEDGRTDLYVTNVGANVLLRNRGEFSFEDVTARAGAGDVSWSTSAAFLDHDADGDLDLFVVNYVRWSVADELTCYSKPHPEDYCSPNAYAAPAPDTLYRNEGAGRYTDVSLAAGLRAAFGNGLGIVCSDFDSDGRIDVFVANDGLPNQLWRNLGEGRFEEVAVKSGCAVDLDGREKAGMGTTAADVDFDGDEDLLVVNLAGESDSFYRNDGPHFSDRTQRVGLADVSRVFTRFGAGFADFDHDGWADLYLANGRVTRAPEAAGPRPFDEPNLLFRGVPGSTGGADLRFAELLPRGGTAEALVATSRAAAFGDVDGDGALDVLVVNRDAPAALLMNRVSARGHWLLLRVREKSGRDALGAIVRGRTGGREIMRTVRSAYSYCAANDPRVHIGLGPAESLEDLTVQWADGEREAFGSFAADAVAEVRRGTGRSLRQ